MSTFALIHFFMIKKKQTLQMTQKHAIFVFGVCGESVLLSTLFNEFSAFGQVSQRIGYAMHAFLWKCTIESYSQASLLPLL